MKQTQGLLAEHACVKDLNLVSFAFITMFAAAVSAIIDA